MLMSMFLDLDLHVVVFIIIFIAVECLIGPEVGLKMEVIILCHLKPPSSS